MDEYHTCVNTLTDLVVKCGNLWAIKYQLQKKQKNRKHMENIGKIEDFVWTCKGFTKKNQEIQWKNDEFVWKSERCLFEWSKNILSIVF